MKPDPRQIPLFGLGGKKNRMEVTDGQKEKKVRAPKRKGFTSSADVELGAEVDVAIGERFINAVVKGKRTDVTGTTTFDLEFDDSKDPHGYYGPISARLGELYRRMK